MFSGYIRVSDTAGRGGDSFISPKVQRETIQRLAKSKGLTLAAEIPEELDVSGGKPIDERKLGELVQAVEAGELEGIIVWQLSRFSRDLVDAVTVAKRIEQAGGRLLAEDYDSKGPMAKTQLGMLSGFAEDQRDQKREGWAQARGDAIAGGRFPGKTPYGYGRDKGRKLIPKPEEAQVVRMIFAMRAQALPVAEIVRRLEDEGIASRGGPSWSQSTVKQILRSRMYLGEQHHGPFENLHAHEPLLTLAEWSSAQVSRAWKPADPRAHSADALVAGIAHCAGCGHTLKVLPGGWKGAVRYYCKGPYAKGKCPARCHVGSLAILDDYVEAWFLAAIRDVAPVAEAEEANRKASKALAALEAAQAELDAFLEHAAALDAADYEVAYNKKKGKRDLARLDYDTCTQEVKKFDSFPTGDLLASWPTLSVQQRKQLIGSVVDRINVSKGDPSVPIADRVQFIRGDTILETPQEVGVELAPEHS